MILALAIMSGGLVLTVLALSNVISRLTRQHDRKEDLMLNQIMHLAGRTWQPPPMLDIPEQADEVHVYVPDQDPDY